MVLERNVIMKHINVAIEIKNKETPFCDPAQRTKPYVTGEQNGVDTVIRSMAAFSKV